MKGVFFGLIIFCALFSLSDAAQVSAEGGFDWGSRAPTLYRNEAVRAAAVHQQCPTYEQEFEVVGIQAEQLLCMYGGEIFRFATFLEDGVVPRVAIASPLDDTFHVLEGACEGISGCVYSAEQDVLAVRYYASSLTTSARIYRQASKKIIPRYDLANGETHYVFDASDASYSVNDVGGRPLAVGAMAFSDNGKWLVVELQNLGTALVDSQTGALRRVIAPGAQYGMGFDPKEELAVSNDGTMVVVMGENAGVTMVKVAPGCGDTLENGYESRFLPLVLACAQIPLDLSPITSRLYFASSPSFDDSGGRIDFLVISRNGGGVHRVALTASGYDKGDHIHYVALGDSFSSGEGELDDTFYVPGTNDRFNLCHTSRRSYPFLLARAFLIPLEQAKSVACSGAKMIDIIGNTEQYWGQGGRLGPEGIGLDTTRKTQLQAEALTTFHPGYIQQGKFVKDSEPLFVTLGIGGNDAGFMDKLKTCAMPGTCEWVSSEQSLRQVGREIKAIFNRLVATYTRLKRDSAYSTFLAVGYPKVIQPEGRCDVVTGILLNAQERQFMDEGVRAINWVIQRAAHAAGFTYLNIEDSLKGAELCSGASRLAMNGLRLGDDISLKVLPMLKIIGAETFHPTPFGQELITRAIIGAHPDLLHEACIDSCGREAPQENGQTPYWQDGEGTEEAVLRRIDFATLTTEDSEQHSLSITLGAATFRPNSQVSVAVDSVTLASESHLAANDGSLTASIVLPPELEEGFYTIHLVGESFSAQAVDVYQVIAYGEQEEGAQSVGGPVPSSSDARSDTVSSPAVLGVTTVGGASSSLAADVHRASAASALIKSGVVWIFPAIGVLATLLLIFGALKIKCSQDRGG